MTEESEYQPSSSAPAQKGKGGLLKWIVIIIIILAALWYFAPDVLFNAIDFVRNTLGF